MIKNTPLSVILNRMKRWQALSRSEDASLVRDLDEALRTNRREIELPWLLKKGSIKIFNGVLEYPIPEDYDEMAYMDNNRTDSVFGQKARFRFTSLQEFYENPDYRNDIAEIRDNNQTFLGVRYRPTNISSRQINSAESVDDWTASDDAVSVATELVNVKEGRSSIRVNVTNNTGIATIKNSLLSFIETKYKTMFHFKWVYLSSLPDSITIRLQVDDSNYLETSAITTQFSGQPLRANQWNLIAHDLNSAIATGTITEQSVWASEKVILNDAPTGIYYFDASHLRQWTLMDFWYYSRYQVATVASDIANQEFFLDANEIYSSDSKLVGDPEWADVIMYEAMLTALSDLKETEHINAVIPKREKAWEQLRLTYPSLKPIIITNKYRMTTDFNDDPFVD